MSKRRKQPAKIQQPKVERELPQTRTQIISQEMSGPLPSPGILAEYDRVHPGLAEIIIQSFQKETEHRHQIERIAMETDAQLALNHSSERKRGQYFGLLISLGLIAGCITLGYQDKQWAAAALGSAGFASIVGAFVVGRRPAGNSKE